MVNFIHSGFMYFKSAYSITFYLLHTIYKRTTPPKPEVDVFEQARRQNIPAFGKLLRISVGYLTVPLPSIKEPFTINAQEALFTYRNRGRDSLGAAALLPGLLLGSGSLRWGGGSLRSPPAPAGPPQRPGRGRGGAAAGPGPHLAAAWPDRAGAAPGAESVAGSRRQERAAGGEDAPGAGKQEEGQGQGHLQAGGQRGGGPRSRPTGSRGSPGRDGERVAAAVPRAAGARQPHGPRGGLRQCPRALRQGGRGFRHRPRRGTARGGVGAGPRPRRLRPPGAQPGAGAGVRLPGWLWPRGCWPASEQSDGAGRVNGCPGVKPGPFVGSPLSGVVEEAVPDS